MSVARSYAKALLDSALESGLKAADLDRAESELTAFAELLSANKELHDTFRNPVISAKDKTAVVEEIANKAGFSKTTTQFLALVARNGRGLALTDVADKFTEVRLESEGATLGTVVSADPLQKSDLEDLAGAFTRKLGKKVVFRTSVDSTLLAGLKVTVNGVTYDGSLRSQLQQLRDRLVYGRT